jgi:murein DD-endopeptidase MepM/ murein hydrolase activator NlpD
MPSPIKGKTPTTAYRKAGKMWSTGYHTGVDYAVPVGTDVFAVQDGTVTNATWGKAYGTQIVIDQKALNDGTPNRIAGGWAIYAHLSQVLVKPGQVVKRGDLIGKTGNTGNSSGPHLHFEVRNNQRWSAGKDVDPMPFINA